MKGTVTLDCLLIADDLTGACDAGAPFAAAGLRTVVALSPEPPARDTRVLAVSTETRDAAPDEIRRAMAAAAALLPVDSSRLIFKKIDSTLRGRVGVEIAAALEAFGCDAAVVSPAFPRMNRMVEGGRLRVTSEPGFEPIGLAERLGCRHIERGALRAGLAEGGILSVDAECDADLDRTAAEILQARGRILWVGSAGLASALARALGSGANPATGPSRRGRVLFCIGSDHPVTLAQQAALLAERPARLAPPECAGAVLAGGEHALLRVPRGEVSLEGLREALARARAAALLVSGGDTASLICRAAGVQSIDVYDELITGIPRGVLRGGDLDGLDVVTKSGGFGAPDALIRIADYFACPIP